MAPYVVACVTKILMALLFLIIDIKKMKKWELFLDIETFQRKIYISLNWKFTSKLEAKDSNKNIQISDSEFFFSILSFSVL